MEYQLVEEANPGARPTRRHRIAANYRGTMHSVAVEDILFLRAAHKYVSLHHPGGELLVDESLRDFEREFPELFLRIHRNTLIARARLDGLERGANNSLLVRLRDCDTPLPVSRRHLADIRRRLRAGAP